MKEKIEQLKNEFGTALAAATTEEALEALRVAYLGKKGAIADLMKSLRDVEDKKSAGQWINDFKTTVEAGINAAAADLKEAAIKAQIRSAKKLNPTLVAERELGSYHPITLCTKDLEEIFMGMGFTIED